MKIESVDVLIVDLGLPETYKISYSSFEKAENVLIRISSGGLDGWGCAAPDPHVTGEYPLAVYKEALNQVPYLLNKDPFRRAKIISELKKRTPGLYSLWAAVDIALWDLVGKKANLPVWKILGGYRDKIKTSVTVNICSLEQTLWRAKEFVESDFSILKIKGGMDVEADIEKIHTLRQHFDKKVRIRFDANQGYSTDDALYFIDKTSDFDIELIEQPTHMARPEQLGVVTRGSSTTPIMADESLVSLLDAYHLVKKELIDLLNIKIMKVGGVSEAIQIDAVARAAGVEVMIGCMDESALGISAGLHFALSRKNIRYADLDGHFGLLSDPAEGCIKLHKGFLYPSVEAGFGWKGL